MSFSLKKLRVWNSREHDHFEDIDFVFCEDEIVSDSGFPFVTLIIGANTTGKSRLLRIVVDIFNDLYNLKEHGRESFAFRGSYHLLFEVQGEHFEVLHTGKSELEITS